MSDSSKLKQLVLRTWRRSREDDVFGSAAKLAYFFLLALFPLLIFLTSVVGFLPGAITPDVVTCRAAEVALPSCQRDTAPAWTACARSPRRSLTTSR